MPAPEMTPQPLEAPASYSTLDVRRSLRALDRKDSWHWLNAVLVIMLLMGGIVSLSLPRTIDVSDAASQLQLALAVRGLLGVVLIFNIYVLYQQYILRRLRGRLATQTLVAAEEKARADALYELAILDPLTGLYNRRFGEAYLQKEIARTARTGDELAVLLLDLNDFKNINDSRGHGAGDLVLKEFARRLKKATRGSDIAVRLGGDEFLVVLPECPPEKVRLVLSRLLNFEVEWGDERIPVFCSSGCSEYLPNDTCEKLLERADAALYAQKAAPTAPRELIHNGGAIFH